MNLHELKPRLLAVAVFAVISSSAFASVDTAGTPDSAVPVLKTYGVDVPTRPGLKTIVPQGWTLLIHKSARLPDLVSWKPGDPWTSVLEGIADKNNLAVRMDWNTKTVTVMSPEVAVQQKAKETEILQAAKTPLPALTPDAPKADKLATVAPVAIAAQTAAVAPATQVGVPPIIKPAASVGGNPAVDPATSADAAGNTAKTPLVAQIASLKEMAAVAQVAGAAPAPQAAPLAPTVAPTVAAPSTVAPATAVPTIRPVAIAPPAAQVSPALAAMAAQGVMPKNVAASQVGGSMKNLLAQVSARYSYVLSWEAPDVEIPGAVTLLGVDIGEDAKLLQKAIGINNTPVTIEVFRSSSVIRVVPRSNRAEAVAIVDMPFNGRVTPYVAPSNAAAPVFAENVRAPVLANPDRLNVATVQLPAAAPVLVPAHASIPATYQTAAIPQPPSVKLTVLKGESLSTALKTFFQSQGWDLQWKATSDLQADYPVAIEATDGKEVMKKLLPRLGLIADFYNQSKTVVIRNSDSSTN
jgi:hypothetical protein